MKMMTRMLLAIRRLLGRPTHVASSSGLLTVYATRDDVHPGDQARPHSFHVSASTTDEGILQEASDPRWLPHLSRSVVAWSITATEILAVVEHDCEASSVRLMTMPWLQTGTRPVDRVDDVLRLHFNYHSTLR